MMNTCTRWCAVPISNNLCASNRDALGLVELSGATTPKVGTRWYFSQPPGDEEAQVELTHNWDPETYDGGRNFRTPGLRVVDDIIAVLQAPRWITA